MEFNAVIALKKMIIQGLEDKIDVYKTLLSLALPIVEEMASLTEADDDAALAAEIKDCLGVE